MKNSMEMASTLVRLLNENSKEEVEPVWTGFVAETSHKMEVIKGIKWDPTNDVDKEIHDMQVSQSINTLFVFMLI